MDEEHLEHRGAGVQQDGLALSDDGERALLRGRKTTPGVPGGPHIYVEEVRMVLQTQTKEHRGEQSVCVKVCVQCVQCV